MLRCPTCHNPQKTPKQAKQKKSVLEEELSKLESAQAVLEQKLHANLTRQHTLRKNLAVE